MRMRRKRRKREAERTSSRIR